ncbi:exopolysaccharide biosynthesis protein [Limnobacter sp.]|uniref:exopolysaccharide biosynthesis protein n=1 Tax=Limnobacter sp. TaxID=2003368 RepID=UPI0035161CE7
MSQHAPNPERTLGEQLQYIIGQLPEQHVTVGQIRDLVGREGLLILVALLTLVFMVPVSIPGVSTVFGAAILLVGVSRLFKRNLWLPSRVSDKKVPVDSLRAALQKGMVWVPRLEKISRPHRLNSLASGPVANAINDCALILAALLLMAPFGFIPFSNTLPGLALLFFAVGLIQRDGAAVLLGHLANLATMAYFGVLIGGGGVLIQQFLSSQGS